MSGDWILLELPWWTHFQRPTWCIAMHLRYGLQVTPAVGKKPAPICQAAKKKDGSFCLEQLDAFGQHTQVCKVEGAAVIRHDNIRDGIVPELKSHVTSVKLEQFIHELALDENTGETQEAEMDIVAESPTLRAMLDLPVLSFHPEERMEICSSTRDRKTSGLRDTFKRQTMYKYDVVCSSR